MLSLPLIALLSLAPPGGEDPASPASTDQPVGEGEPGEFGELEVDDDAEQPAPEAGGGYGTLTPLPNYGETGAEPPPVVELAPAKKPKQEKKGFEVPEDYGPFFEPPPVSEVEHPGDAVRPDRAKPFASVAGGRFCFVEDAVCDVALLIDADVGVGLNMINSGRGLDVPHTQFRIRWGATVRPLQLAGRRERHWHPWGVGLVGSWSLGSGSITASTQNSADPFADIDETQPIRTWRVGLINQLWLNQRRNALHIDFTIGGANSTVLNLPGRYWGTHAELALGFGGWAAGFVSADFLDEDLRLVVGVRGHGMVTIPLLGLVMLGLVAGGVAL